MRIMRSSPGTTFFLKWSFAVAGSFDRVSTVFNPVFLRAFCVPLLVGRFSKAGCAHGEIQSFCIVLPTQKIADRF